MKLNVAIQMDHVSTIDIDGDSTFVLGLEAERRGYTVWHYTPPELIFRDRKVMARAQPMKLRREKGNHFTLGASEMLDLSTLDVVLLRQDPPFDMSYITTTHILEHIHPKTLVVNDPASVRNAPEKLFVTHFDNVMPPTLISSDPPARPATSTGTSSGSRCSATAAPAFSACGPTTRTSIRCSKCSPSAAASL